MPLIDTRCKSCDKYHEQYRPLAMWPATPQCPDCGADTEQVHLPKRTSWTVDPVVVFQAPDGTYRFPGDRNGLSASTYEKQGFKRMEIRSAVEMRSFESRMNKVEYSRAQRRIESKEAQRAQREADMRGNLRQQMQSMSNLGRAVAQAAMRRNDAAPRERFESGFHSEVYNQDRSSREASRDEQGRRRRD